MRSFDYIKTPEQLLKPEIVQMVGSIHEHKGKQELFLEANIDELKTLLEVALIQSTGASNRIEGIYTTDKRLEELVDRKPNHVTGLNRKYPDTGKFLPLSMKVMSILIRDPILFYNCIGIYTHIPEEMLVEIIKIRIM